MSIRPLPTSKIFNARYNLLAGLQVFFVLVNSVLLIQVFGVSAKADAYLLAVSTFAALQLVQLMAVEQFMYFYSEIREEDPEDAFRFCNVVLILAAVLGILFFLVCYLGIDLLLTLFAHQLDEARRVLLRTVLGITLIGSLFTAANYVIQRFLNAEMRFALPYVIEMGPMFFTMLALIVVKVSGSQSVATVAWGRTLGCLAAFVLGLAALKAHGVPLKLRIRHPRVKALVTNSFSMKFGHNIHNFLFTPVTINILSTMPEGYASYFYYAHRVIEAVHTVVVGPSMQMYLARVSVLWSRRQLGEIKGLIRQFMPVTLSFFAVTATLVYLSLPTVLRWIGSQALTGHDISTIRLVFLALTIWFAVIVAESAYVSVGMASRDSKVFIYTNSLFILVYTTASYLMVDALALYAIPAAAILGQIINFFVYRRHALGILAAR